MFMDEELDLQFLIKQGTNWYIACTKDRCSLINGCDNDLSPFVFQIESASSHPTFNYQEDLTLQECLRKVAECLEFIRKTLLMGQDIITLWPSLPVNLPPLQLQALMFQRTCQLMEDTLQFLHDEDPTTKNSRYDPHFIGHPGAHFTLYIDVVPVVKPRILWISSAPVQAIGLTMIENSKTHSLSKPNQWPYTQTSSSVIMPASALLNGAGQTSLLTNPKIQIKTADVVQQLTYQATSDQLHGDALQYPAQPKLSEAN